MYYFGKQVETFQPWRVIHVLLIALSKVNLIDFKLFHAEEEEIPLRISVP
jgi:hypothetical protein